MYDYVQIVCMETWQQYRWHPRRSFIAQRSFRFTKSKSFVKSRKAVYMDVTSEVWRLGSAFYIPSSSVTDPPYISRRRLYWSLQPLPSLSPNSVTSSLYYFFDYSIHSFSWSTYLSFSISLWLSLILFTYPYHFFYALVSTFTHQKNIWSLVKA